MLRPCTLPARARASASESATAYPPRPSGTATRASGGLPSSAKPAAAEHDTAAPRVWATPPFDPGPPTAARSRSRRAPGRPSGPRPPKPSTRAGGLHDGLPAGAPAQVGHAGPGRPSPVGTAAPLGQGGQAHHDARGAEAALAGRRWPRTPRPTGRRVSSGEPVEGGHLPAGQAAHRGDTGHPGGTVDPHRAAAALALGAAAVLDRADAQLLAQHVEQGRAVVDLPRRRRRRRAAGSGIQRIS